MGYCVDIPFSQLTVPAYLSTPETAQSAPAVLVLHAWWGLNDFIQRLSDRLSQAGFLTLAPDLYHGKIAATIPGAKALRRQMDREQAGLEITAALEYLQALPGVIQQPVGMVGFSLGAYLGMQALEKNPKSISAVVLFYGGRRAKLSKTRASFMVHLAENDPFVTVDDRARMEENIRSARLKSEFCVYPGTGHWFFEDDRQDAYQPGAAQLAWERTLAFLEHEQCKKR